MEISDGDSALFDVCCVLNMKLWPKLQEGSKDDENLSLLFNSVKSLFEKSNNMEVFHPVKLFNMHTNIYLNIEHIETMKLWSKLLKTGKTCHLNLNKKNTLSENPTKVKEYNSISINLQVKVAHVLAKKSVKYNMTVIFHHLYSRIFCYSGF